MNLPRWIDALPTRMRSIFKRARSEQELDEELSFHLAMHTRASEERGLSHAEAERRALLDLQGLQQTRERSRDTWPLRWADHLLQDLRYGVRSLRGTPIVTTAAIFSLALAIGANTAMFSIVNGLLLRALPVRDPSRLVLVTDAAAVPRARAWDYATWEAIRQRSPFFDSSTAWSFTQFNLAAGGETQFIAGIWATGSFFDLLGVSPVLGRTFSEADDRRGGAGEPAAVISYGFWQRQFANSPDVIGRLLRLNTVPFTIVGVTPPDFFGTEVGRAFDVIVPLGTEPLIRGRNTALDRPGQNFLSIMARLGDGHSLESATTVLRGVQPAIREETIGAWMVGLPPDSAARYLSSPLTLLPAATGVSNLRLNYRQPVLILAGVVSLVLLIACVNVANLLVARAIARRHELSVRLALGGSRWRIARQLFIESLLLSSAGAAIGSFIAAFGSRLLVTELSTPANPVFLDVSLDARVLGFTIAVTALTALLFGTAPAFRAARVAPMDAMKDQGRATGGQGKGRLAGWLVTVQVALSVVLVVAAGLFIRSFSSLTSRNLGFEASQLLVVTMDAQRLAAIEPAERVVIYERTRDAVRGLPGVADAAISFLTPVGGGGFTPQVEVSGAPPDAGTQGDVYGNLISAGWFRTFGTPIVAGRDLTDRDRRGTPRVAIVNEAFVRRVLGGSNPIGRTLVLYPRTPRALPLEIVGVAADQVYTSPRDPAPPTFYAAMAQFDVPGFAFAAGRLSVRAASGSPGILTRSVAAAVTTVNPQLALTFQPLSAQLRASLTRERLMALLAGFFGVLALLLAGIGLYGVTAYAVSRRRTEIGVRLALGAAHGALIRMMLMRVLTQVALGIAVGAAISYWASKFATGLIYGLAPRDLATLAGAAAVLFAVGVFAGWLPAWRAARMDPLPVLRES